MQVITKRGVGMLPRLGMYCPAHAQGLRCWATYAHCQASSSMLSSTSKGRRIVHMASETIPPQTPPTQTGSWFRLQWLIPLLIAVLLIYAARTIITPFVVAVVLAYLLDPFVAAVHRRTNAPRGLVVVLMALLALAALGTVIALLA